jgi:Protein of unknown function (DUF2442)
MNISTNNFDTLEQLIYEDNIRIKSIEFRPEADTFFVSLNTGKTLSEKISRYPGLIHATREQLDHYELIGKGTGIHWPELDEDLSLKGFLRNSIRNYITGVV